MNFKDVIPHIEAIPEESRLVRRAKSGDSDAFVQLFDAYGDDVYRYVYFRVMSDVAAEAITSHVFRFAWEHLDSYQKKNSSFVTWIYEIVRNQVIVYYKANLRTHAFNIGVLSVAADYGLNKEPQDRSNLEAWGGHLRLLTADKQQSLMQMTALLVMRRYLDYLNPRREFKPAPTFNAYTRSWLTRYLQFHARLPKRSPIVERTYLTYAMAVQTLQFNARRLNISPMIERMSSTYATLARSLQSKVPRLNISPMMQRISSTYAMLTQTLQVNASRLNVSPMIERMSSTYAVLTRSLQLHTPRPKISPLMQRMSLPYAMLIAALVITGTAEAQSALPGDALYGWKRTSEQAWLSLSPDPVGTDIILANRRLNEWIAVEKDPARSAGALNDYFHALTYLNTADDAQTRARIRPMLQAHREKLHDSGLSSTQLDNYLAVAANPTAIMAATQVAFTAVVPPATQVPTQVVPTATSTATEVATAVVPTATEVPTEVLPTATEVPTEVLPTATEVPTEVLPTATQVPTEVLPTATEVPTEVPPTATQVPTEVPPTATAVPTEVVPIPTMTPVPPLDPSPQPLST